jgi:hypothetical protein
MNGVKTTLGELCEVEGKSVLQAVSLTQKLAAAFTQKSPDLNDIGARIYQMGSFNINFSDDDRARLVSANAEIAKAQRAVKVKQIGVAGAQADAASAQFALDQKFGQDSRYVKELAGNYQNYAAGQAMIGAGQGMAEHGVGGGIAALGAQAAIGASMGAAMGGGMGGMQGQPQYGAPPQFTPGAASGAQVTCPKCAAHQPAGKFCAECGTALAQQKKFCTSCGGEVAPNAKFCPGCGTSTNAPPPPAAAPSGG